MHGRFNLSLMATMIIFSFSMKISAMTRFTSFQRHGMIQTFTSRVSTAISILNLSSLTTWLLLEKTFNVSFGVLLVLSAILIQFYSFTLMQIFFYRISNITVTLWQCYYAYLLMYSICLFVILL